MLILRMIASFVFYFVLKIYYHNKLVQLLPQVFILIILFLCNKIGK